MQKDFTIEMHYEKTSLQKSITKGFDYGDALQMIFTLGMHYKSI